MKFRNLALCLLALAGLIHGCTVHYVRAQMDDGPIIIQAAVPVLPDDDADRLAARVLAVEHRIFPTALALVASERARVVGHRVVIADAPPEAAVCSAGAIGRWPCRSAG